MSEEVFEIFNEKNESIGTATRNEVHKIGHFHRAVNIFVVNSKGKVLITKRAKGTDTAPGEWGMSAAGHLQPGESFEHAAKRELEEELGLKNVKLKELRGPRLFCIKYPDGKIDNEFDALFLAESDEKISMDSKEVAEGIFLTLDEIQKEVEGSNKIFTPYFLTEWEEFKELRR